MEAGQVKRHGPIIPGTPMNIFRQLLSDFWRWSVRQWHETSVSLKAVIIILVPFVAGIIFYARYEYQQTEAAEAKQAAADAKATKMRAAQIEAERIAFAKLTPSEHFAEAKAAWEPRHANLNGALRHLNAIPESSSEYREARYFLLELQAEKYIRDERERQLAEDRQQAVEFEKVQREAEKEDRMQRKRDEAAEFSSYIPTKLRVDTDMNSFWLDQEERTCQSYPGGDKRVSYVSCNPSATETHNIPVTFWGGVDRGKTSSWKCRRDGDKFICRAID